MAMSVYVSCQQNNINLQPDSCVCHGCEMDFLRNRNNPITPRWLRLKNEVYTIKHCILCCKLDTCDCQHIQEWGPSEWCDGSIEWWSRYLTNKGLCTAVNPDVKHICRNHLREFRIHLSQRTCVGCSLSYACKWFSTDGFDWLCNTCEAYGHGLQRMDEVLDSDKDSSDCIIQERAKLIKKRPSMK